MRLFSRRALTESVARKQIVALSDFGGGLMRPDKCSEYEPIRTPFDPADVSKPVRWLSGTGGEFLYQKGRPIHVVGHMRNYSRPPSARFPAPPFINDWAAHFDGRWANRIGTGTLGDFVTTMFRLTGSDFGFLTTEVDLQAKNTDSTSYSYQGMNPMSGVPGLYWVNYFSCEYAQWLGLKDFPKELATLSNLAGGGLSLKFCASPDQCRDIDVVQKQRAAIEWLGPEKFFDIRFSNRNAVTPEWEHMPLNNFESVG